MEPVRRCDQTGPVDVDEAADRLYALPPGDFVEARDALVRQVRAAGDRGLARAIADLRKPTAAAWVANRLARERRDQLADFLALGPALREASATLSGPALRDLSRQRQQLVQALVREARQVVAGGTGPQVSEDVARGLEATLHAALVDPDAAASVAAGRLSGALSHSGFGAPPGSPAVGGRASASKPATTAAKKTSPAQRRATEQARAESELAQARTAARDAAEQRDAAVVAAFSTATAYDDAAARVRGLRDELASLQDRLTEAERARERTRDERNRAAATSQAAGRRAERARKAVTDLEGRLDALRGRS